MALLVDYRCAACGATSEHFVASPIPAVVDCAACGRPARRVYGGAGLLGVGLRKAARERLDRERAERVPSAGFSGHHAHHHPHHGHDDHAHDDSGHHHGHAPDPGQDHDYGPSVAMPPPLNP